MCHYAEGFLVGEGGVKWRRVKEWLEPDEVKKVIDISQGIVIEYCDSDLIWYPEAKPIPKEIVKGLITREKGRKQILKRKVKTRFVAELWENKADEVVILFFEGPPAPRTEAFFA